MLLWAFKKYETRAKKDAEKREKVKQEKEAREKLKEGEDVTFFLHHLEC